MTTNSCDSPLKTLALLIDDPNMAVDPEWTDQMAESYPYMVQPAILELQRTHPDDMPPERRKALLRRIALNSPEPRMACRLDDPDTPDTPDFYPPQPRQATPSTEQAIDDFIDRYGGGADSREEEILERLIFNPVPDYGRMLAEEEERSLPTEESAMGDSQDSLINAFIIKSRRSNGHFPAASTPLTPPKPDPIKPDPSLPPVSPPAERPDDSLLSESLAKIFIKQGRYSRAYEIISQLNLKYPEKSVYFADQLRFLQKLIINQKHKNKNK